MHLSMTIDNESFCKISSLPVIKSCGPNSSNITDSIQLESAEADSPAIFDKREAHIDNNDIITTDNNEQIDNVDDHSTELLLDRDDIGLLAHCDNGLHEGSTNDYFDQTYNGFE